MQKLSSIRVDIGKLDKLVNLVGGLITVEARLESFEDAIETRDPELAEELLSILDDSSRILRELQDQAMNVRMVPIGGAFDSLHRMVRDYCKDTGKQARLIVTGQDTEVDKKVSEQISAPLKHIIRNALDHGIEAPAERIAQGKSAEGQITLAAYHQYGLIVIQVQDDGKGIDVEAVTQSARRKGIIDGSRELSKREALELIFAPSVSTATVVTEVSGRGVGMDVVKRDIEALRGKVDVATEPRMGTTITLSIPQTLSIVECLVVSVGPNRYSIPLSSVEECVELAPQTRFCKRQRRPRPAGRSGAIPATARTVRRTRSAAALREDRDRLYRPAASGPRRGQPARQQPDRDQADEPAAPRRSKLSRRHHPG